MLFLAAIRHAQSGITVVVVIAIILALVGMARPPLVPDLAWRFLCWAAAGVALLWLVPLSRLRYGMASFLWVAVLAVLFLVEQRRESRHRTQAPAATLRPHEVVAPHIRPTIAAPLRAAWLSEVEGVIGDFGFRQPRILWKPWKRHDYYKPPKGLAKRTREILAQAINEASALLPQIPDRHLGIVEWTNFREVLNQAREWEQSTYTKLVGIDSIWAARFRNDEGLPAELQPPPAGGSLTSGAEVRKLLKRRLRRLDELVREFEA